LWQLKKTLPKNLADNRKLKTAIEFVLIDFGSTDGLNSWIKREFKTELKEGYLKYYSTNELSSWHASIAKNTAHLLATGKILTNLDCDNFTGKSGGLYVINCFKNCQSPIVFHQFSGNWKDGSCGRISVKRKLFFAIGGYDEQFEPMGFQDLDIMVRLWSIGLVYHTAKNRNFIKAIPNTKQQGIALCNSGLSYEEMNLTNKITSLKNLKKSRDPLRNNGVFGIQYNIVNHKNESVVLEKNGTRNFMDVVKEFGLAPPGDLTPIFKSIYHER
jgi:hypothetical protein